MTNSQILDMDDILVVYYSHEGSDKCEQAINEECGGFLVTEHSYLWVQLLCSDESGL